MYMIYWLRKPSVYRW